MGHWSFVYDDLEEVGLLGFPARGSSDRRGDEGAAVIDREWMLRDAGRLGGGRSGLIFSDY